jgi:hypothetical protein
MSRRRSDSNDILSSLCLVTPPAVIAVVLTLSAPCPCLDPAWVNAARSWADYLALTRDFLLATAGACATGFSVYFGWRRFSTRILVTCSTVHQLVGAGRIDSITLINKSDRPLTIFALHGVDKGKVFEIEKFKEPKLVKPLESLFIATTPFSTYGGYELRGSERPKYYVLLDDRAVECELINPPHVENFDVFDNLTTVTKITHNFNSQLIDEGTKFAVVYQLDGSKKTALVLDAGIVVGDWKFGINAFTKEQVETAATLHATIQHASSLAAALGRYGIWDFATRDFAKLEWPEPSPGR